MKNEDVLLYLQAKDQEEYEKIIICLKAYYNIPTEKIYYDSENLRVNLNLTYDDLLETSRWRGYSMQSISDYQLLLYSGDKGVIFQLTDKYKQENKEAAEDYQIAMEKIKKKQYIKSLKQQSSKIKWKREKITNEELLTNQVIIVQDAHDNSCAQEWIIENAEKFKKNKAELFLLVEFSQNMELEEIKKQCSSLIHYISDNKSIALKTERMIDIFSQYGTVLGGEDSLSVIANNAMFSSQNEVNRAERLLYGDAAFAQKTIEILEKAPSSTVVIWVGSAHAKGIMENILTRRPFIQCGAIYPDIEESLSHILLNLEYKKKLSENEKRRDSELLHSKDSLFSKEKKVNLANQEENKDILSDDMVGTDKENKNVI